MWVFLFAKQQLAFFGAVRLSKLCIYNDRPLMRGKALLLEHFLFEMWVFLFAKQQLAFFGAVRLSKLCIYNDRPLMRGKVLLL
ncbi:MAG: hypothetical protein RRY69_04075 [Oscillospiraceae bacterium]